MKVRIVVTVVIALGVGTLSGAEGTGAIAPTSTETLRGWQGAALAQPLQEHPTNLTEAKLTEAKLTEAKLTQVKLTAANTEQASTTASALEAVASHLEGVMSTTAQAAADPNFVGVQMLTCRVAIAHSQPDSIYLYQEQALVENLSSPYRQRFLQLTPGENGRLDSRTFKPETPSQWTGLCAQPDPVVSVDDLGELACTVSLRAAAIGGFVGSTPPEGCTANVRGAVRITNVVVLHEAGMDTWDRGFDEQGNRVWGAQDIPYRYRR